MNKAVREGGVGTHVYATLRTMVLDLKLAPGAPLVETELSASLGVSRTPIREALGRLAREGLVRQYPGRGAFVSEISLPDLIELYQMREALETYAARLAAESANDAGRAELAELLSQLESQRSALAAGDNAHYYQLMAKMDGLVVRLAGNKRLAVALSEIWAQISRARRVATQTPSRLLDTVDEHEAILSAIRDGDAERAATATRQHVRKSLANIKMAVSDGMI
jgi:DNA-binding GntR family transcriptional regulator